MGRARVNEGWTAYWEGEDLHDNPYPEGTNRHEAWEDGWVLACEEARGKTRPDFGAIVVVALIALVLYLLLRS